MQKHYLIALLPAFANPHRVDSFFLLPSLFRHYSHFLCTEGNNNKKTFSNRSAEEYNNNATMHTRTTAQCIMVMKSNMINITHLLSCHSVWVIYFRYFTLFTFSIDYFFTFFIRYILRHYAFYTRNWIHCWIRWTTTTNTTCMVCYKCRRRFIYTQNIKNSDRRHWNIVTTVIWSWWECYALCIVAIDLWHFLLDFFLLLLSLSA